MTRCSRCCRRRSWATSGQLDSSAQRQRRDQVLWQSCTPYCSCSSDSGSSCGCWRYDSECCWLSPTRFAWRSWPHSSAAPWTCLCICGSRSWRRSSTRLPLAALSGAVDGTRRRYRSEKHAAGHMCYLDCKLRYCASACLLHSWRRLCSHGQRCCSSRLLTLATWQCDSRFCSPSISFTSAGTGAASDGLFLIAL